AAERAADHAAIDRLADELVPALIAKLSASGLGEIEVGEGPWTVRVQRPADAAAQRNRRSTDRASRAQPGHAGHGHPPGGFEGHRTARETRPVAGAGRRDRRGQPRRARPGGRVRTGADRHRARHGPRGRARRRGERGLMFRKILIANRGEIALRILRACRTLGIEAVVAYSEADRESLPVQLADEAICIGPADARRSYLSAPAVISAAIVTGCDAIHPGYGFLSEDEGFAEVVRAHDLTFIGPPANVLDRFSNKESTRRLLGSLGLPTIPGSDGMLRDEMHALGEAERIGYPVLIKPS